MPYATNMAATLAEMAPRELKDSFRQQWANLSSSGRSPRKSQAVSILFDEDEGIGLNLQIQAATSEALPGGPGKRGGFIHFRTYSRLDIAGCPERGRRARAFPWSSSTTLMLTAISGRLSRTSRGRSCAAPLRGSLKFQTTIESLPSLRRVTIAFELAFAMRISPSLCSREKS